MTSGLAEASPVVQTFKSSATDAERPSKVDRSVSPFTAANHGSYPLATRPSSCAPDEMPRNSIPGKYKTFSRGKAPASSEMGYFVNATLPISHDGCSSRTLREESNMVAVDVEVEVALATGARPKRAGAGPKPCAAPARSAAR